MGTNESVEKKVEPLGWQHVANRHKNNLAMYQVKSRERRPYPAPTIVGLDNTGSTTTYTGQQNLSPLYSPEMLRPMQRYGPTHPTTPAFVASNTVGQLVARPVEIAETVSPLIEAGNVEQHSIIDNGRFEGIKAVNQGLQEEKRMVRWQNGVFHQSMTTSPSATVPITTLHDLGLYNRRYPGEIEPQMYNTQSITQHIYPRGYSSDPISQSAYQWTDINNYQDVGSVVSPYKQQNEDTTRGVYNDSIAASTLPIDTAEEKRKHALNNLLIRPIIQMKGGAWDDNKWRDYTTFHSFHAACTDFLRIIELTKDKKMALEIKEFLGSELLTPRYIEKNHPPEANKKLNHFHVFWNLMHQLPFAIKKWDAATAMKLKLFYEVWVTETMQCSYCRGHYQNWIKEHPVEVTNRGSLNWWLFSLHNDVNKRSAKPQFEWSKYNQRWGSNDYQSPESNTKNSTITKKNRSKYSTLKKSNTFTNSKINKNGSSPYNYIGVGISQKTPQFAFSRQQEILSGGQQGHRTPSSEKEKKRNPGESLMSIETTVRELTGLDIDEELATLKHYNRKQKPLSVAMTRAVPVKSLPRRCLSRKKTFSRRNRAYKPRVASLPRKRVWRRGKRSKRSVSRKNRNKERHM